jgi:hypothetical protein
LFPDFSGPCSIERSFCFPLAPFWFTKCQYRHTMRGYFACLNIHLHSFCFCFFFSTGVLTQGLVLARQVLYHLSMSPALFCFSYYLDRVSLFNFFASDQDPSPYGLPCSWDHRHVPLCLVCLSRLSLLTFFLRGPPTGPSYICLLNN